MTEARAGGAVVGVGIDVAGAERFERLLRRSATGLWAHWYTRAEAEECLRHRRPGLAAAVRFAVKEATYKAVGAHFADAVRWRDVEVLGPEPAWRLSLHGEVAAAAEAAGADRFHVSTSQRGGRVVAVVIAEGTCAKAERETPSDAYAATRARRGSDDEVA